MLNIASRNGGKAYKCESIPNIWGERMPVVKRSVAIHPLIDAFVRKTWALLIEQGYDATYSTALNFMLLGAIFETTKKGGWSEETRRLLYNFLEDRESIEEINKEDLISNLISNLIEVFRSKTASKAKGS